MSCRPLFYLAARPVADIFSVALSQNLLEEVDCCKAIDFFCVLWHDGVRGKIHYFV